MSTARLERPRVLIAGGGVAALEALLGLRSLLGGRHVELTLLAPEGSFLYRPVTVAEAFGRAEARNYALADILDDQHAVHVADSLSEVDPDSHALVTGAGKRIEYDALIVATGALAREPLPGALTFRGRSDVPALHALLDELADGTARSVAFALPSERVWALPLYELAMMTAAYLRERGASDTRVILVTPEEEPLALFGPHAATALKPMLRARGVAWRGLSLPASIEEGALILAGGGRVSADRVVTLARLVGPRLPGLPCDADGFIPVDAYGRVAGLSDVYAAGDITAFPLKQGGLAAQQADTVAETIAASLGVAVSPQPFIPVLRGLLLTSGAPLYLRAEPQREPRHATIAIEEPDRPQREGRGASAASDHALWWPPAKIAGRYLAPYLATARPTTLAGSPLTDRNQPAISASEHHEALELALLLADCDARWGDFRSALTALEAAEALEGVLPAAYEAKRRHWLAETARRT